MRSRFPSWQGLCRARPVQDKTVTKAVTMKALATRHRPEGWTRMDIAYFRTLVDYNYWARDRLIAAVTRVAEAEYLAPRPMDYGSIHGTLVHAYAAESLWRNRWQGTSPARMLGPTDVPSLAELAARWLEEERQIRAFLAPLTDEELQTVVHYRSTEGKEWSRRLWETLAHLINHGTNHRSEVAAAVTQLG